MSEPLTRVRLVSVHRRINVYLRFGSPVLIQPSSSRHRHAFFAPDAVFCRIWWERNDYGTTRWQLVILQALAPRQPVQAVVGVAPGATILLRVEGERLVKSALRLIGAIEAQDIELGSVAPAYWRVAHNRLVGRAEIGFYGPDRHAAETLRQQQR